MRKPGSDPPPSPQAILFASEKMRWVLQQIDSLAPTSCSVLITGETGTGKELAAQALHARSPRAKEAFVILNCGVPTESLLENELFGHEKGSFSGAHDTRPGLVETAHNGTIFLDEIGEASSSLQVKLLRVLEDGSYKRIGGQQTLRTNIRLLAATHRDLPKWVAEGRFRQDLYYRLSSPELYIPPLRERREDVQLLSQHFLRHFSEKHGRLHDGLPPLLSPEVQRLFAEYAFPGNVRELKKVIETAVVQCRDGVIEVDHLPRELRREPRPAATAKPSTVVTPHEVLASRSRPPPPRDPSYSPVQRLTLVNQVWTGCLRPKRVATLLQTYRGGGYSLARQVVAHSPGLAEAWLTTETLTERCSEPEFFSELTRQPEVRSQLDLRKWLQGKLRDRELIIVLFGTRGPEELLEQTAEVLRSMQAAMSGVLLLVVGGERLLSLRQDKNYSWLRLLPASSLFDVPALSLAEVEELLQLHKLPTEHAKILWQCSGGHPWLLYELVQNRLFAPEPATAHLLYQLQMERKLTRHLSDPAACDIMRRLACDPPVASPEHRPVASLANPLVRHEPSQYAEARLYFDGFLTYPKTGPTQLRCPAVQALFQRNLPK